MTTKDDSESDLCEDKLNDSDLKVMNCISLPRLRLRCKSKHLNNPNSDYSMSNYTRSNHNLAGDRRSNPSKKTCDYKVNFVIFLCYIK